MRRADPKTVRAIALAPFFIGLGLYFGIAAPWPASLIFRAIVAGAYVGACQA